MTRQFYLMRETPEGSSIYIDETDGPFEASADEVVQLAVARQAVDGGRIAVRVHEPVA
jgi:hypothetical protein